MTEQLFFTSTTAPNKKFASRAELAQHYKSDWHRYNLKRKEANLPCIPEEEFKARLEAALALRREREQKSNNVGVDHLKKNSRKNKKSPMKHEEEEKVQKEEENNSEDIEEEEEKEPVIDPLQSLFDSHVSKTLEDNVAYMKREYGFFLPDSESLVDLEGLLGYAQEKIHIGHICLYCQKAFSSGTAVRKHMIDAGHCKLRYEEGIDLDEWEVFYDFSKDNEAFLKSLPKKNVQDGGIDEDEEEWEDIDSDDDMGESNEDNDLYDIYEEAISSHGFGVTDFGELILPSGKVIGHRTLARYYKQKFTPDRATSNTAVQAVLQDRMGPYHNALTKATNNNNNMPNGRNLQGNVGKGILVASSGGGYSTLSLYRYRAAVKKTRREEARAHRFQMKVRNNGNKFDKKGNRLMNDVCVAKAPR